MLYICLIVSYLVGSLSAAIIVSRAFGLADPRSYGSHNAGATNVMRSGNKTAAILTLLGDFLKGFLVVLAARSFGGNYHHPEILIAVSGIFVVIGHMYPIYFGLAGGKGVATAIGVILGLSPLVALGLAITWLVVFGISRTSSLAALIATVLAPVYAYLLMGNSTYFGTILLISFFVLYKHKANIIRLLSGKEHKFVVKEDNSSIS